jgi:iron complex transport system substrate-binding protein
MRLFLLGALAAGLACGTPGCTRCREPKAASNKQRVVTLAPSLTEMVCAIGAADLLVGRTSACNFPPDSVKPIPVVGGYGDPSIELLVAAKPTLILDAELADAALTRKIDQLGLRRERIVCRRLDEIPGALHTIGKLVNREQPARALAERLQAEIIRLRDSSAAFTNRPTVFVEIWNDPLTTAGKGSYLSDLIALAGGVNLGDEVATDYFQVAPEWVVARNPAAILCFYQTENAAPRNKVMSRAGWEHVAAVRDKRVYDGFDNDVVLRPGPRVLEGLAALRQAIRGTPGEEK